MTITNEILHDVLPKYIENPSLLEQRNELENLANRVEAIKDLNPFLPKETLDQVGAIENKVKTLPMSRDQRTIRNVFQKIIMLNKDTSPDPVKLNQWIDAHSTTVKEIQVEGKSYSISCQEAVRTLGSCLKNVTLNEFFGALEKSITGENGFNSSIKEGAENCIAITCSGKSNRFMYDLSKQYLTTVPVPVEISKNDNRGIWEGYPEWLDNQINQLPDKVVFFDDASYSGSQLSSFIASDVVKVSFHKRRAVPKEIHVVCPYMTDYAYNLVSHCLDDTEYSSSCKIIIHPHERILTVKDAIEEKYPERAPAILGMLTQMYWRSDKFDPKAIYHQYGAYTRGDCWFPHKMPDDLSFPSQVKEGLIYSVNGMCSRGGLSNIHFIPEITSPYKIRT